MAKYKWQTSQHIPWQLVHPGSAQRFSMTVLMKKLGLHLAFIAFLEGGREISYSYAMCSPSRSALHINFPAFLSQFLIS